MTTSYNLFRGAPNPSRITKTTIATKEANRPYSMLSWPRSSRKNELNIFRFIISLSVRSRPVNSRNSPLSSRPFVILAPNIGEAIQLARKKKSRIFGSLLRAWVTHRRTVGGKQQRSANSEVVDKDQSSGHDLGKEVIKSEPIREQPHQDIIQAEPD